jgi:hypothetical protein
MGLHWDRSASRGMAGGRWRNGLVVDGLRWALSGGPFSVGFFGHGLNFVYGSFLVGSVTVVTDIL